MPVMCEALGCKNRRGMNSRSRGITFHSFPSDADLKRQWEAALGRGVYYVATGTSKLCSEHFGPEDLDKTGQTVRLRDGATPSFFILPSPLDKSVATQKKRRKPVNFPRNLPESQPQPNDDHCYALPDSPVLLKVRLHQALMRVEDLEREKVNAKSRERRAKRTIKRLLLDLKKQNFINEKLKERLGPQNVIYPPGAYVLLQKGSDEDVGDQQKSSHVDQEKPESPQVHEIQVELSASEDELKQETDEILLTPANLESSHSGPDPNHDQNSALAENPDQREDEPEASGSRGRVKQESTTTDHVNGDVNGDKSPASESRGQTDSNTDSVECDICGNMFKDVLQMLKHKVTHAEAKPYPCRKCGKDFTDKNALLVHMKNHIDDRLCLCTVCGKRFGPSQFWRHTKTHTGEKPHVCKTCGKGFGQKNSLSAHMRTHTGERPFSCETCGKSFVRGENLAVHRRIHTGERAYSCEICGKTFGRCDTLTNHKKIHTGEKLFSCETCGRSFVLRSSLNFHMKTHSGKQIARLQVPCKICGKCFAQNAYLRSHMRTHTGEKPFSCEICGRGFAQKCSRNVHMKVHARTLTGDKPYSCKICGKGFSHNGALNLHSRIHKSKT